MSLSIRAISAGEVREVVTHLLDLVGQDAKQIENEIQFINWWFYSRGDHQDVFAAAFMDGDEPAGYVGYANTQLRCDGNMVRAGTLSSAMTNPKFRGLGVFSSLIRYLVERAAKDDLDLLYGSPNAKAYGIYIARLGFTDLFHWHRFGRPKRWDLLNARFGAPGRCIARIAGQLYDKAIPLHIKNFNYTLEKELPDDFKSFIDHAVKPVNCNLMRTPEYCRWRFSRPGREYRHVILRNNIDQIAGWAAFAKTEDSKRSRLHIGDYWVTDNNSNAVRALMAVVYREAAHYSVDEIYGAGRTCSRLYDLRRLGFIRKKSQTPLVAISPTGRDLSIVRSWEFRDSDADMF